MEEVLRSLVVVIECSREDDEKDFYEQGTGVLIHTNNIEYDYIITAYHCLAGSKDKLHGYALSDISIKSRIYGSIKAVYTYDDIENDISIIKIEKMNDVKKVNVYKKEKKEEVIIFAYPGLEFDRFGIDGICEFRGKIDDYKKGSSILTIKIDPKDMNIEKSAQKKMGGSSGAGVFLDNGNSIQLVGVITEVDNDNNVFNTLIATSINVIEQFIEAKELVPIDFILDKKIIDFNQDCFSDLNRNKIQDILTDYLGELKNLKIKRIIDLLNEKVIFPCIGEAYNDDDLWKSWAEFITFMIIYSNCECGSCEDEIIEYLIKFREDNTKFYYSYVNDLADIVKNIYADQYDDSIYSKCRQDNTILVDFKSEGCFLKHIESENVARIVSNISNANCISKKIELIIHE